jgi:hypothetical protein
LFVEKIVKINVKELKVEIQEEFGDNTDYDDVQDELPSSVPRYIILTQKLVKADGRITFPLAFIYYVVCCELDFFLVYLCCCFVCGFVTME